jgi:excisionase family DNA binding protein
MSSAQPRQFPQPPDLQADRQTFTVVSLRASERLLSTPKVNELGAGSGAFPFVPDELPLTVRQAAVYLGVSIQTVYLWVERKQIPHLRVMGRNIRFLRSDLEPFRATFKCEVGDGKTKKT